MDNKVTEYFKVRSYEVDLNKRLKPYFVQTYLQEAGYAGSQFCGAGYDALRAQNLAWVINRIHIVFNGLPVWGDEVKLDTWSRGKFGPLWIRNFRMYKGEEQLLEATSSWTVLDLEHRSIFRGMPPFIEGTNCEEDTLPFCTKLVVPEGVEMKLAGSHTALFSELDTNGHVNNCCYTEWAIDALPYEYLASHQIKDIEINFLAEVSHGMEVEFHLGREADDIWYVSGIYAGIPRFLVRLEFR